MALSSALCGADNGVDVAEWSRDHEDWLKKYLALNNGTPSHDTFGRVFRLLDAADLEPCFHPWIEHTAGACKGVIALEGKTLCGSRNGKNAVLLMIRLPPKTGCVWAKSARGGDDLLCNDLSNQDMIPFKTRMLARSLDDFGEWSQPAGEAFVDVLSGEVELFTEYYEPVRLSPGGSWYIDCRTGHHTISVCPENAEVLWVSTTNPRETQRI